MNSIVKIGVSLVSLLCLSKAWTQTFTDVAAIQGINVFPTTALINGAGVSFYDFNQDGWDDLSFVMEGSAPEFFFNNNGNFQPAPILIPNNRETKQLLWVDYDNNGVLDLFIARYDARNQLLHNDGNFNFTDVTLSSGIAPIIDFSWGGSFGDYNKDGFLDLYVCKYALGFGDSTNLRDVNNLYRNNGDGTFTDVTFSAGVSDGIKASFCSVWFDYNNDTWPDLYVVNDRIENATLFRNNADGTFTDVTVSANMTSQLSNFMSGSVADYDNDNDLDLFVSNTSGTTGLSIPPFDLPMLFNNQGDGTFIDAVDSNNLFMENSTWGGVWLDYDNDGNQDLYVATDYLDPNFQNVNSYFFRNLSPNNFVEDTTVFVGNQKGPSFVVARGDFDRNGFYDIVVQNEGNVRPFLLQNSGNTNNFVRITLEGTVSNRFAIGSWIRVFVGGKQYNQYTLCGENYIAQNSQHHIFGLGPQPFVDSVHVEYLSGIVDRYYNLIANQDYHFIEGETSLSFQIQNASNGVLCTGDTLELASPLFDSYFWNTGDTSKAIEVLQAGTYFLTAIDSNGLLNFSDTVQIIESQNPVLAIEKEDVTCYGLADGFIRLALNSSVSDDSIYWSNGMFGDSIINLTPGSYMFTYVDSFLCQYMDVVNIEEPEAINVQKQVNTASPNALGSMLLLVNGGIPPYQLFLNNLAVGTIIQNLDSGMYYLEVVDLNSCAYRDTLFVPYEDTVTTTGIQSSSLFDWKVYPIPSEKLLYINFIEHEGLSVSFTLHNALGQQLVALNHNARIGNNQFVLNLDDLLPGMYYLSFERKGQLFHKKIWKQ